MTDGIWVDLCDRAARKPKILLVDDAPGLRLMVSLCLRLRGFEIVEAETSQEAMAIIDGETIDLVLSDVSAGSTIDGIKFLRWLLQRRPELPLLVTSSDAKKAQEAGKLGPRATIIAKPYDIDLIADSVRALLNPIREVAQGVPAHTE